MFILFLYLMSYHAGRGLLLHALLGITLFALFILHHLLNLHWYRTLFRGKYSFRRSLLTASDILLLAAMLLMMLSALMLSGMVFSFSTIPVDFGWIEIHYFSTAWGFMLMAFHLGLHLHSAFNKLDAKLKETSFEYVLCLLEVILFLAGAYGFVQSGLWSDMVLRAQSITPMTPVVFYTVHIGVVAATCLAAHWIILAVSKLRKRGS